MKTTTLLFLLITLAACHGQPHTRPCDTKPELTLMEQGALYHSKDPVSKRNWEAACRSHAEGAYGRAQAALSYEQALRKVNHQIDAQRYPK